MPNSSNDSPLGTGPEVEDIFSEADPSVTSSVTAPEFISEPVALASSDTPGVPLRSRRWLVIAIIGGGLLVLVGIGVAAWLLVSRQVPTPSDTNDNTIVTNANEDIINVSPDNTNTPAVNTNVNTAPVTNTEFTDVDHDGLSDQEELVANTNPKKKDTDEDGLSDREEVRVYLTDPRNPDTDGDGYADGKEVENFYHPNDPDPKKRLFDLPN